MTRKTGEIKAFTGDYDYDKPAEAAAAIVTTSAPVSTESAASMAQALRDYKESPWQRDIDGIKRDVRESANDSSARDAALELRLSALEGEVKEVRAEARLAHDEAKKTNITLNKILAAMRDPKKVIGGLLGLGLGSGVWSEYGANLVQILIRLMAE